MIIDEVIIDGVSYYGVTIEDVSVSGEPIEVTCGGLYEHGPEASLVREYRPGFIRTIIKITTRDNNR